jgi:hypothetical protein
MANGGWRPGAGRPRGARNKRTDELAETANALVATLHEPFKGDSIALMQTIYKDTSQPMDRRMAAAAICAKYERPICPPARDARQTIEANQIEDSTPSIRLLLQQALERVEPTLTEGEDVAEPDRLPKDRDGRPRLE